MPNNPNLAEAREKAFKSPRIGKRGKAVKTLHKEKLRAEFTQYFGERMFLLLESIEASVKRGDANSAFRALEQLIGKPDEKKDLNVTGTLSLKELSRSAKELEEHGTTKEE